MAKSKLQQQLEALRQEVLDQQEEREEIAFQNERALMAQAHQLSRDIASARAERAGLAMLRPMNQAVQMLQQHRGLSSGVLNGNEAMKDKRAAKEKEASDALAATDAALSTELRSHADWKAIREDWEAVRSQGLSWSTADNVKRHSAIIDKALLFMVTVADNTSLTLARKEERDMAAYGRNLNQM